ncbi:prenyltransferase/squalene oxidase repeat-containing protein [Tundrisphaera sp. TA3]|uniref:prenyltransferase/squalene oxidase repeat-containing protein n=1 Tax=Tundrisphaera sp. TA3 TaxID=3435775 RepID=UPI003EBE39D3
MPHAARPRWRRIAGVRVRRLLHRLDREAPAWVEDLPSWGTSLLIHAVALVVLATFAYVTSGPAESEFAGSFIAMPTDDITSLGPADQSGDPFNAEQTPDTPSLAIEPADATIAQPPPSERLRFSPDLVVASRSIRDDAAGLSAEIRAANGVRGGLSGVKVHVEDMTAPFAGRMAGTKGEMVRREGGSTRSEKAVQEGLAWLARHQAKSGGWHLNVAGECNREPGCPGETFAECDTAATGLALLPFLGAGHIHTQPSPYQENVRRGLEWLLAHQSKEGELFIEGFPNAQFYAHAIATMALCEAYGLSKEDRLKEPCQRAIGFIERGQNKQDGGWRYSPGMPGDTSVLGWQMFALRSARLAGLDVSANVLKGCSHYLDLAAGDRNGTAYGYMPGRPPTPTMNAEGLLCRQYLGWTRDKPALVKGVNAVWGELQMSGERNIYYWYYATQLLHNMQNKAWRQWNPKIRDGLVATQIGGDGCDRGSWSPFLPQPDRWGLRAGRVYETALSVLTLEVYYRFLPLYRPSVAEAPKL